MDVIVRFARQPAEIDGIFSVRHDVYAKASGYMSPRPDSRIYDRFDAFWTTQHIIAVCDNTIIGSTRLTQNSTIGPQPMNCSISRVICQPIQASLEQQP